MTYLESLRANYLDQPNEISLETLALCNARCTFCPYPTMERIGDKMPDELIDRVIDEMATFTKPFMFSPFKVNEPLLDSRLIPLCEIVNEHVPMASLRIFTNGSPLTKEKIEAIAKLKRVQHLWISLNEVDPEKYHALMGLKFEITSKRLDVLHEMDFPHPVMLSTVGYPNEEFRYYCWKRWPKFESMAIVRSEWLGQIDSQIEVVPDIPCSRWFELSIMASGIVSLCCMDSEGRFQIGDINKQSLLEIYNAPAWRERREKMLSRKELHPCSTCTYGGTNGYKQ
jgi:hypothetical protein